MTRWLALALVLLAAPLLGQTYDDPQDAGVDVKTRFEQLWPDMRDCLRDWFNDPGNRTVHANLAPGPLAEFPQAPWRQTLDDLPLARQGTSSILPVVPGNKDEAPTDRDSGMTQQEIFDACIPAWGGADDFGSKVIVLKNGPDETAGSYNHWAYIIRFAFAWDSDDLGTDPEEAWCYDRSDPLDWYTDDSVTDWHECTEEFQ